MAPKRMVEVSLRDDDRRGRGGAAADGLSDPDGDVEEAESDARGAETALSPDLKSGGTLPEGAHQEPVSGPHGAGRDAMDAPAADGRRADLEGAGRASDPSAADSRDAVAGGGSVADAMSVASGGVQTDPRGALAETDLDQALVEETAPDAAAAEQLALDEARAESTALDEAAAEQNALDEATVEQTARDETVRDEAAAEATERQEPLADATELDSSEIVEPDLDVPPEPEKLSRFVQTEAWMESEFSDPDATFESTRNTMAEVDLRPDMVSGDRSPRRVLPSRSSDASIIAPEYAGWGDGRILDADPKRRDQRRSPLQTDPKRGVVDGWAVKEGSDGALSRRSRLAGAAQAVAGIDAPDRVVTPAPHSFPEVVDPDWWEPMAARVRVVSVPEVATASSGQRGSGSAGTRVASGSVDDAGVRQVTEGAEEGQGQRVEPEEREGLDLGVEQDLTVPEVAGEDAETADGVVEVDEVSISSLDPLGAEDEHTSRGRPLLLSLESVAAQNSAPRVVFDDPGDLEEPKVSARRTERAVYLDKVYDLLWERWNPSADLTLSQRALGVTGNVTVRFVIEPSGKIRHKEVVKKSGNAYLDYLALDAIPRRLPRFHSDLERVPITHEVTFRMR